MSDMDKIIGENLKTIRVGSGLTQEQIASFVGITRTAYGNYELGEREAPYNVLEQIANLFGCDASLFFEKEAKDELLLTSFRLDESMCQDDLKEIARFKDIVKSYLKMERLLNEKAE